MDISTRYRLISNVGYTQYSCLCLKLSNFCIKSITFRVFEALAWISFKSTEDLKRNHYSINRNSLQRLKNIENFETE